MVYMLIAGEASGDLHASHLMASIRRHDPEAQFVFLGGDLMAAQAGREPVVHYRDMAYMGFSEVIRNIGSIRRNLKLARKVLEKVRPDCLILIDYPSFNLKVAATAHNAGIPVYYYISPKVWAWKEWRVKTIKKLVDKMFVIFPFEVEWYRSRHGMDVTYVGNPSIAEIDTAIAAAPDADEFSSRHKLRQRPIIALLPGSRRGEIRNNLPIMLKAAAAFVQYQAVVAGAPGIEPEFYAQFGKFPVVTGDTMNLLAVCRAALVTSGTATLEAALAGVPQVACYRANGSELSYKIMQRLLSVDFVTLPNLILGREAIAEKLLHQCTPVAVAEALSPLTALTSKKRQKMLDDYKEMRAILGDGDAAENTARLIVDDLHARHARKG